MAQLIEVRVPDLGDYKDVEIIEVAVRVGDTVAVDATLLTLETEKATMDVPSTAAGVVRELKVQRGGRVSKGDLIAIIDGEPARSSEALPAIPPRPAPAAPQAAALVGTGVVIAPGFSRSHASPSIRRFARELGVDLATVTGTGEKGRITEQDVKSHVKRLLAEPAPAAALPRVPEVDFAAFGPIERKPLSRIQKISGPRLHASWVNIPHVTQFDEADITEMEATRAGLKDEATARGIKLTPLAFIMRACAQALQAFPHFGASLDAAAGELVYRKYVHLGFAADTPGGLVVPVVRDADRKDVFELARDLAALSEKARAGKLAAAEMQGGCFTISSLGGIGGTAFTPIINAPEVAILGVSRASHRPVYENGTFVPRLMLPLSLSYDHRVIDGADAVRFTTFLAKALADVQGLLRAIP
ncbi:MAG: biotin/lipoyl-binding protein [Gammaproteobacteria bacterium]|nr:biotin/lipoyl-binding protein [Gammaproteobacteria bacterium]